IAAGSGPDKWVLNGQKASTTGEWREGTENPAESHEIGHLMGLGDKYIETGGHVHGHAHDVMNTNDGFPFESGIEEILKIGGFKCDCCPDPELTDAFMQDLNLLVVAARDAANACNRELLQAALDQLKNKRREVGLVAGMSMQDKVTAAAQLDRQIAELEKALRDCPEEDKALGVLPGGDLRDLNIVTDSNEWCTYGGGDGTFITPIPLGDDPRDAPVPGGDDPRDGPGTPSEGDDPRDTPTPADDDPRGVPPPSFVKAKAAVIDGPAPAGNAVAGQTIKLLDTGATDVALPGQSPERPDVGYDGDPLQCRTDGNGDCKIEVPPCGETDP